MIPQNFHHTIDDIDYRIEYVDDLVKPKTFVYYSQSGDLYFYSNHILTASQVYEYVTKMRNEYAKGFSKGKEVTKQDIRSKLGL